MPSIFLSTDLPEQQKEAMRKMLRNILAVVMIVAGVISALDGVVYDRVSALYVMLPVAVLALVSLLYLQNNVFLPARIIIPFGVFAIIGYILWFGNGLHDVGISALGIVIILAGLTLGETGLVIFGFSSALILIAIGIAEMNGYIRAPIGDIGVADLAILSIVMLGGAFLMRLLLNRFHQIVVWLQRSESQQARMNVELVNAKNSLEDHVASRAAELSQRTADLETVNTQIRRRASQLEALTQVTQAITAVRDLRELLPRITSVISEKFGFYHVGIFLLDEISQYAILSAANSDGGRKMIERKHRLRVGAEGIVGYVTAAGKPRIALDVGKDAVYFNNLELSDTHSEMALPLIIKNIIVGALDVQSKETSAFTDDDARMLSLLSDQVSLAIENARLFDDARKALTESEMISRSAVREAWARLPDEQRLIGYRYNVSGAVPLHKPLPLAGLVADEQNQHAEESDITVVPIEIRGESIGNLVVQAAAGEKWSSDQLDLIKAVAERVALSAENARLFEETTARAERERLVSEITGRIRSQTDPQEMIRTAMDELRGALGATRVEVIPQAKNAGKSEA